MNIYVCLFAEGLPHSVLGAGAGESEGGAGHEEQPAAPEGEKTDGDGEAGKDLHLFFFFSLMLIIKIVFLILFFSLHADIFLNIWMCVFVSVLQVETNVKLEECLKKVQQENEDFKARMDKHAALSK